MGEELDGHIQKDPIFREMADIYSTLGGKLPTRIFSGISEGKNMNEIADRLIEVGDSEHHTEENVGMFLAQAKDIIEDFEEKKLVQEEGSEWHLTNYGQKWRAQMDAANYTLTSLVNDGVIAASQFEAEDGQIIYNGEGTLGDFYSALGFNVEVDAYPEALPVMHILGEEVNNGEVPPDYSDAAEQLEIMGMVENTDTALELTEVGTKMYEEVVLDDREFVKDHYGFD